MKMCKLKNGKIVPQPVVITTMIAIEALQENKAQSMDNILALYELSEKCKNPQHKIFSKKIEKVLEDFGLLNNHEVHDIVKDIVISAVSSTDEFGMPIIGSPVAEISDQVSELSIL